MFNLIKANVLYSHKREGVRLLLASSVWIYIFFLLCLLCPEIVSWDGERIAYVSFAEIIFRMNTSVCVHVLLLVSIASSFLYEEKKYGQIWFYRDVDRTKVFYAKTLVLVMLYLEYVVLLSVNSAVAYFFLYAPRYDIFTGTVMDINGIYSVLAIVCIVMADILRLFVGIFIAASKNIASTIAGVLAYHVVANVAKKVRPVNLLFVEGYLFDDALSNSEILINSLMVFGISLLLFTHFARKRFAYMD